MEVRSLFYNLNRYYLSGAPLSRWLIVFLLLGGTATALGWAPGGWPATGLWLLAAVGVIVITWKLKRQDFIAFHELPAPVLEPKPLPASEKVPIHASGHFHVEGKYRRFAWIEGYFRTFATREHAALCLVPPSRFLGVARWPDEETGMWYCFVMPAHIQQVRWGEIHFRGGPNTGVAVDYQLTIPKQGRLRPERTEFETLYLACESKEEACLILADLLYDLTVPEHSPNGTARNG
jgi:hypothetical protein